MRLLCFVLESPTQKENDRIQYAFLSAFSPIDAGSLAFTSINISVIYGHEMADRLEMRRKGSCYMLGIRIVVPVITQLTICRVCSTFVGAAADIYLTNITSPMAFGNGTLVPLSLGVILKRVAQVFCFMTLGTQAAS